MIEHLCPSLPQALVIPTGDTCPAHSVSQRAASNSLAAGQQVHHCDPPEKYPAGITRQATIMVCLLAEIFFAHTTCLYHLSGTIVFIAMEIKRCNSTQLSNSSDLHIYNIGHSTHLLCRKVNESRHIALNQITLQINIHGSDFLVKDKICPCCTLFFVYYSVNNS